MQIRELYKTSDSYGNAVYGYGISPSIKIDFTVKKDHIWIDDVLVNVPERRKGLGKKLVSITIQAAKSYDLCLVKGKPVPGNNISYNSLISFWQTCGFKINLDGEVELYIC